MKLSTQFEPFPRRSHLSMTPSTILLLCAGVYVCVCERSKSKRRLSHSLTMLCHAFFVFRSNLHERQKNVSFFEIWSGFEISNLAVPPWVPTGAGSVCGGRWIVIAVPESARVASVFSGGFLLFVWNPPAPCFLFY